jgi:phage shock protein C
MFMKKLVRSETNRKIAGISGGLGQYFNIDPTLVRIGLVLALFLTGFFPVAVLYAVAIFVVPNESEVVK